MSRLSSQLLVIPLLGLLLGTLPLDATEDVTHVRAMIQQLSSEEELFVVYGAILAVPDPAIQAELKHTLYVRLQSIAPQEDPVDSSMVEPFAEQQFLKQLDQSFHEARKRGYPLSSP